MDAPTLCSECDHVHPESRSRATYMWLCAKHKKLPGYTGFVSGHVWERDEPFLRCRDVNGGACQLFKAKRNSQMEMIGGDAT